MLAPFSVSGSETTIPPPPPPPGLPPPPPLPPPDLTSHIHGLRKKKRVRSFFWKVIPEEKVRGKPNIWTMAARQSLQYQMDVQTIEELFGQQEDVSDGITRRVISRASKRESKDEVRILDSKRSMNVGIFLKQFKKQYQSLVEDIRCGNSKPYGPEPLKELLKLLPEVDEVYRLKTFKGDVSKLSFMDSFMYVLVQVPRYDVRLEAMVLREEFSPICSAMSHEIEVMRSASKELMDCEELHAVLHLVLQAGNIMNAGGYAGNAVGFKLSSLLSLADTKANKPGMNLLHFVALEAQKKDDRLLAFTEKLPHVQRAARMSVDSIEDELHSLQSQVTVLEEKIEEDHELQPQLEPFVQKAEKSLEDLTRSWMSLRNLGNLVIDFFCEEKDTFKLDECFRIFLDFCVKFQQAVKDNQDRKQKEAAREQHLQDLEEKRHSWSSEEQMGSFSRSSSENDVRTLSSNSRLDRLLFRPLSPLSPVARSVSMKRSRQSTAAAVDRELRSYLERASHDDLESQSLFGRSHHQKSHVWLSSQSNMHHPNKSSNYSPPLINTPGMDLQDNHSQEKPNYGQMNVSVETHMLVPGLQGFDFLSQDNRNMALVNHEDVIVRSLESETDLSKNPLDIPSSENERDFTQDRTKENDEDNSTVSSTACDTHLLLDSTASLNDTDVDSPENSQCQEAGNSLGSKENIGLDKPGLILAHSEVKPCISVSLSDSTSTSEPIASAIASEPQKSASTSVNKSSLHASNNKTLASASNNKRLTSSPIIHKPSFPSHTPPSTGQPSSTNAYRSPSPSASTKRNGIKRDQMSKQKAVCPDGKMTSKGSATQSSAILRMLNASENQSMRKVVPISRPYRYGTNTNISEQHEETKSMLKNNERPPSSWHSSLPLEDPKKPKARIHRKASMKKPTRPLTPKPPPEEKMCRSTMRALAQATSEEQPPLNGIKALSSVPSFARNTVASSSRWVKSPTPSSNIITHSKGRTVTQQQGKKPTALADTGDKTADPLHRVQSLRMPRRVTQGNDALQSHLATPTRNRIRKDSSNFSDKSIQSKDTSASKIPRPLWK